MRLTPISGPLVGVPLDFSTSENLPNPLTSANTDLSSSSQYVLGGILLANPTDGFVTTASVPNWMGSELLYVRSTSASAIRPGRLVTIDKDFTITDLANTANQGVHFYVTLTDFAVGSTIPQGGWVMRSGIAPVQYAVAATAGKVYVGGAGQATPTAAAGKQLLGMSCLIAASGSFTRTVRATNGSKLVEVSSTAGMYIGMAVSTPSNTPIPASSTIDWIAPDGRSFRTNNAAVATASATGTFTHTNFGICHFDRPVLESESSP